MKIPKNDAERLAFLHEVLDTCLASRQERLERYARNRAYYFHGSTAGESAWNLIYSHLDTVSSFLYAADSTRFSVKMGIQAGSADRHRVAPFAKLVMEAWKQSNADVIYQMGILWSLIYDSAIIKHIRRDGEVFPYLVDPACFGVYREDVPMLDRQEAFVHVYYITKSALEKKLADHSDKAGILKSVNDTYTKQDTPSSAPSMVNQLVLTSGQPGLPMANVMGQVNVDAFPVNDYIAKLDVPVVEMHELYLWDDEADDYRIVTLAAGGAVIYDRENFFIPRTKEFEGEHGFVQICPNPLPDYFWGQSEVDKLAPVQEKLNARMQDIERLEQKQVDPPNAWGGMGLPEEKLAAFNSPGADIAISDANFRRESFVPQVPEHIYEAVRRFQEQMDTVSGLPNVVQGKGEAGVRSAGHAGKLLTVGSSRAKKRAMIIEDSLEKGATLYGRCLYVDQEDEIHDDTGVPFIPSQMDPHFTVEIDAHSNSPIFQEDHRELANLLLKAHAIDRARYIQMLHPPMEEELLNDLKDKIIPAEQAAARAKAQAEEQQKVLPKK